MARGLAALGLALAGCGEAVPGLATDLRCGGLGVSAWSVDRDGDGFTDPEVLTWTCEAPEGYVAQTEADCDDEDPTVYPGAPEVCGDGQINDCDDDDNDACEIRGALAPEDADAQLLGVNRRRAGYSLAGAGDADGDGYDDLLIGAYPDPDDDRRGGAYLVLGPVGGEISLDRARAWLSGSGEDGAGYAVSGAGDTDGDGYDDLLVGAPWVGDYAGAVYLVSGASAGDLSLADEAAATILGASDWALGRALAQVGDTNGDGLDDLLLGAPRGDGGAYLVQTPIHGAVSVDEVSAAWTGPSNGAVGTAVSSAGDLDGDGLQDLLLGDPDETAEGARTGAVYVILGTDFGVGGRRLADADARLDGQDRYEEAGASVAAAGDTDGDGYPEIFVGAPWKDSQSNGDVGTTYVVSGPFEGTRSLDQVLARVDGTGEHDIAGASIAGPGDVDGDGHADLLIGASRGGALSDGRAACAAFLVYGPFSGRSTLGIADASLKGDDLAGWPHCVVAAAGDTDGDGYPDLLIGAPGAGFDDGAAYLLRGGGY